MLQHDTNTFVGVTEGYGSFMDGSGHGGTQYLPDSLSTTGLAALSPIIPSRPLHANTADHYRVTAAGRPLSLAFEGLRKCFRVTRSPRKSSLSRESSVGCTLDRHHEVSKMGDPGDPAPPWLDWTRRVRTSPSSSWHSTVCNKSDRLADWWSHAKTLALR
ncbi:hypothetical protein RRG08_033449 [Elysia crispata]|uniref:Uncharacterized protein n=1 Tax=Elysia crispata TaxID=231223 RepID=A0AAE1AVW7_9GAST|nr:hypothetical protein RRG08_033449 [Elysia crispata]